MTRRELFKAFIAAPFVAAAAPILAKISPPVAKNPILSGGIGRWEGAILFEASSKATVDAWSCGLAKEVMGDTLRAKMDHAFFEGAQWDDGSVEPIFQVYDELGH